MSIGTHDLDTIQGPFTYEALPPSDIKFAPLDSEDSVSAVQLFENIRVCLLSLFFFSFILFFSLFLPSFFRPFSFSALHLFVCFFCFIFRPFGFLFFFLSSLQLNKPHLEPYLGIIESSPVYPVFYDRNRTVLSLPPIINGNHSKIVEGKTKNVLIEITATDKTKALVVLNIMIAMFAQYCSPAYSYAFFFFLLFHFFYYFYLFCIVFVQFSGSFVAFIFFD